MLLRAAAQLESPAFFLMNVFSGKFVLDVTHLVERIGISSALRGMMHLHMVARKEVS